MDTSFCKIIDLDAVAQQKENSSCMKLINFGVNRPFKSNKDQLKKKKKNRTQNPNNISSFIFP